MLWSDRVKKLMRERQMTQIELADKIGYTYQGLNRLLSGRGRAPTLKSLNLISKELGVTSEYLQNGINRPSSDTVGKVPVLPGAKVTDWVNSPETMIQQDCQWVALPVETQSAKTFAFLNTGDDMTDYSSKASIPEGSLVFVEPGRELEQGMIAAAVVNDDLVIRKLQKVAGEWLLSPANQKYQAIPLSSGEYIGRAVSVLNLI